MKRITVTLLFAAFAFFAYGQGGESSLFDVPPPQPTEYGKCYAKCKTPDIYETVSTQVLVKEGGTKASVQQATYDTVEEQVLVKDGYKKYKIIPATFTTTEKRVLATDGTCKISVRPAKYETRTDKQLVSSASGKWVRKKKAPNCLSSNPDDCYVLCWEEIPAKYTTTTTRVLIEPERYDTSYTDAKYKTIKVQTLSEPARVEEEYVPPVYKTVTKKVLLSCGGVTSTYIEPQYETKTRKVLVSQGSYGQWEEVVCAGDVNTSLIRQVQQALNDKGYDAGTVDGVMGSKTRAALAKFQQDNGLPLGNLNIATMQALGVR